MRIVLPELPQSSAPWGGDRRRAPRPSTTTTGGSPGSGAAVRATTTPRAERQASVDAQSPPGA